MFTKPKYWRPGDEGPGSISNKEDRPDKGEHTAAIYNKFGSLSLDQQRQKLPIFQYRSELIYLLENFQTLVLIGETGCGKSTQLPQYLLEAGWASEGRAIAITQPRRVAVTTLASRVADERGSIVGGEIGYTVRFDAMFDSSLTKVKFLTDGLLIRELMSDPLLTKYSIVVVDEAHERSINTDVMLGLLKKIARKRKDLRIVVASATLDAELFLNYFNLSKGGEKTTSVALTVEGRMYPVKVMYASDPVPDYLTAAVNTCIAIHKRHRSDQGDILVFLTGQDEVENVVERLIEYARTLSKREDKLNILPMYGGLPTKDQYKVFERPPRGVRKIVVATNIAEASITISSISFVVDCGFCKLRAFNADLGIESLVTQMISRASAQQRAGRAGRSRAGQVYRLYKESDFTDKLREQTIPEMQRTDLSSLVLQLKALGIDNVVRFPFLSPPPAQIMVRAVQLLYALGALDEECRLTSPLGGAMAELPMHPTAARMLIASDELQCSEEVVTIAAMMQIQNIYDSSQGRLRLARHRRRFAVEEGDHISMLNVYNAFIKYGKSNKQWCGNNGLNFRGMTRAVEIRNQLRHIVTGRGGIKLKSCGDNVQLIQKSIVYGFFCNAARYHPSGEYRTLRDQHGLALHPTSVLSSQNPPPTYVVFSEVLQTSRDYMRDVTVIDSEWLYTLAPHYYSYGTARERDLSQTSRIKNNEDNSTQE